MLAPRGSPFWARQASYDSHHCCFGHLNGVAAVGGGVAICAAGALDGDDGGCRFVADDGCGVGVGQFVAGATGGRAPGAAGVAPVFGGDCEDVGGAADAGVVGCWFGGCCCCCCCVSGGFGCAAGWFRLAGFRLVGVYQRFS